MKKIRCKKRGLIIKHVNPDFFIEFNTEVKEVEDNIADFLVKDKPDLIELVEEPKETVKTKRKKEDEEIF